MDFFEAQDQARKRTRKLVFLFSLAVIGTMAAVYLTAALGFHLILSEPAEGSDFAGTREILHRSSSAFRPLWDGLPLDTELFFLVITATGLIIFLGSSIKTFQLSKGGAAVATLLGGRPIPPNTSSPKEKQLLNIVEEMSIASGVPVPQVFLLENEMGINAFASGFSQSDAVVGITHGALELFTRDELQGVIAHEFSHILNGDMRLNMQLTCLTHGILFIASTGLLLLRLPFHLAFAASSSTGNSRRGGIPPQAVILIMAVGLALTAVGSVGYFFSSLIKSAISRQREYLADAAAVQFTRLSDGIGGALKKIGGMRFGSRLHAQHASEASHFFFANGLSSAWFEGFSTHPPLVDRILKIDPHFDGNFPKVKAPERRPLTGDDGSYQKEERRFPGVVQQGGQISQVAGLVAAAGSVSATALEAARSMTAAIPVPVMDACHEPHGARAVAYAALISRQQGVAEHQWAQITQDADPGVMNELLKLHPQISELPNRFRLVLLDLSLPALRSLSPDQYAVFRQNLTHLVAADQAMDLFEYCLEKILVRHLDSNFQPARKKTVKYSSLVPVWEHVLCLLGALAYIDSETYEEATQAFRAGIAELNIADRPAELPPVETTGLGQVDEALNQCALLSPMHKRNLLFACSQVVLALRGLDDQESELLRAIADTLGCPLPPFVTDKIASGLIG